MAQESTQPSEESTKEILKETPVTTPAVELAATYSEPSEPKPTDATEEYIREQVDAFLGEKENIVEKEVAKSKETEPETEPQPESKTEGEPEPEAEFDVNEFSEEVSQKAAERLVEKLTGKTTAESKEEGFTFKWNEEERNPASYEELAAEIARKVEFDAQQQAAQQDKEWQEQQKLQEDTIQQWNEYWNGQIEQLRKDGVIEDGKKAEEELFTEMYKFNQERIKEGRQQIYDIDAFIKLADWGKGTKKQPAGADAPISGGTTSVQQPDEAETLSWEEIHQARNYEDLLGT